MPERRSPRVDQTPRQLEIQGIVKPLNADQRREAGPAIRGYVYQIWQTVLHWMALSDNEFLYVERAEDLDIVAPGKAIAIQVARRAAPVTLRSPKVLETIKMLGYEPHEFAGTLSNIAEGTLAVEPLITGSVVSTKWRMPSTTWPAPRRTQRSWPSPDGVATPRSRSAPAGFLESRCPSVPGRPRTSR
jgi:hypothetical protein